MKVKLKYGDSSREILSGTEFTAYHPHLGRPIQEDDWNLPHWAIYLQSQFSRQIVEYPRLSFEPVVSEDFKNVIEALNKKCESKLKSIFSGRFYRGEAREFYLSSGQLIAKLRNNIIEYDDKIHILSLEELYYLHLIHKDTRDTDQKEKVESYKSILETINKL